MTKRPDGALEHDILRALWAAGRPLKPAEVKDELGTELAYNSVATVLNRLQAKGLVRRTAADRGFAYEALLDESALAVRRIQDVLDAARDRDGALMSFIGGLSRRDRKALLRMLAEDDEPS